MVTEKLVRIEDEMDIVAAREVGREMARELGFGLVDQTRLATAISELTRNVIQYAGKGICMIRDASDSSYIRIQVVVEDNGPGIPDINKALQFGYSTSGGLGAGLPGTKQLVHEFQIVSHPGLTRVTIAMVRARVPEESHIPVGTQRA
jgi:serine/threonine-protein kinase RsbT